MNQSYSTAKLLAWLDAQDVLLHPALDIAHQDDGRGLCISKTSGSEAIAPGTLLAQIPLTALLSAKSSSLPTSASAEQVLRDLPPNARLAVHLLHEWCLGTQSAWFDYIQCFAVREAPSLAFTWSAEVRSWLRHTELESIGMAQWEGLDTRRLEQLFMSLETSGIFSRSPYEEIPSATLLIRAFCFVQSRAFWVDNYHTICFVPLADM